jgi:hypothetical protein
MGLDFRTQWRIHLYISPFASRHSIIELFQYFNDSSINDVNRREKA